jgi:UDP-N-acetylmuramyl pentapeptide phosphotransferase/UDP-N-acetylglucosamine-1-phosphate transferase
VKGVDVTNLLLPALGALALSMAVVGLLLHTGWAWRMAVDRPNRRSLHDRPIPRVGGWGIIVGALGWVAMLDPVLGACAAGLALLSFGDDRMGLSASLRLLAHLCIAALWLFSTGWLGEEHLLLTGCAVIGVAWGMNLYNFMDGADGLAGGMGFLGFGFLAAAAGMGAHPGLAAACAAVAGSSLGFLLFNFHPARVFMGDAGSVPLGFLMAAMGMHGWSEGVWPLWFPLVVFAPFVADATFTLVRRALRREAVWRAHRDHFYQRLVLSGFGHGRTAVAEYGLMFFCGAMGLVGLILKSEQALFGVFAAVAVALIVFAYWIERRWATSLLAPSR